MSILGSRNPFQSPSCFINPLAPFCCDILRNFIERLTITNQWQFKVTKAQRKAKRNSKSETKIIIENVINKIQDYNGLKQGITWFTRSRNFHRRRRRLLVAHLGFFFSFSVCRSACVHEVCACERC
jgi:hypothetical protein